MSIHAVQWEHQLLNMAYEALESHSPGEKLALADNQQLAEAYQACEDITRQHSRTFYLASGLLPEEKRRSIRALYAFCRLTDDLVDHASICQEKAGPEEVDAGLEAWRRRIVYPVVGETDPVVLAWTDTRMRHGIPVRYAEQLIHGVGTDLHRRSYSSFHELATYCYGVACTVGLMSMHIIGYHGRGAFPYAIRLGVALQLTNILRDVGEDWQSGRVYLPEDELQRFGLGKEDLARVSTLGGRLKENWRAFMRYQITRTRRLYSAALPGVALLEPDGRFAIEAAAELYRAILEDIEAHDYDVFRRRAFVSTLGKARRLPGIWWRAMFGNSISSRSREGS